MEPSPKNFSPDSSTRRQPNKERARVGKFAATRAASLRTRVTASAPRRRRSSPLPASPARLALASASQLPPVPAGRRPLTVGRLALVDCRLSPSPCSCRWPACAQFVGFLNHEEEWGYCIALPET